jgi:peptidoglycan/xylan/chitin deacetylase (PgdA/CDA1 family)
MFRLDRLFTLYFFHPLAKRFPPKNGVRIPILMYHSISDERETGHPYYWINTSPALFAKHIKFLHDNGYQVISLSAAVDLIKQNSESSFVKSNSGSVLLNQRIKESSNKLDCSSQPISNQSIDNSTNKPVNYVVLTFDDGYRDFYTSAFEVLKE